MSECVELKGFNFTLAQTNNEGGSECPLLNTGMTGQVKYDQPVWLRWVKCSQVWLGAWLGAIKCHVPPWGYDWVLYKVCTSQYQFLDCYSLRWTHLCKSTHWLFVVHWNIPCTLQPLESIQVILYHPKGKQFQKSKILFSIADLIWLNFLCFYLVCHLDVH